MDKIEKKSLWLIIILALGAIALLVYRVKEFIDLQF